ncbi:MAG TPA: hypothetical protein PK161_07810 [Candidatus Cloacimonadota bacterium]|nr:hypothetical protein [Candidatus Cloacimonadota bacterium]
MDFGERLEFFLPSLSDLEFFLPSQSDLESFLPSQPIVCHDTIRQNGLQRASFRERHLRSPEFHLGSYTLDMLAEEFRTPKCRFFCAACSIGLYPVVPAGFCSIGLYPVVTAGL